MDIWRKYKRKSKRRKVVLCGASLIISQPSKFHYPTLLFWRRIWKLKSRGSRLWAIPCWHYWVLVYRNSDYIWGASSEDINPVSLKVEPFPSSWLSLWCNQWSSPWKWKEGLGAHFKWSYSVRILLRLSHHHHHHHYHHQIIMFLLISMIPTSPTVVMKRRTLGEHVVWVGHIISQPTNSQCGS